MSRWEDRVLQRLGGAALALGIGVILALAAFGAGVVGLMLKAYFGL